MQNKHGKIFLPAQINTYFDIIATQTNYVCSYLQKDFEKANTSQSASKKLHTPKFYFLPTFFLWVYLLTVNEVIDQDVDNFLLVFQEVIIPLDRQWILVLCMYSKTKGKYPHF